MTSEQQAAVEAFKNALTAARRSETLGSEWLSTGWRVVPGREAFLSGQSNPDFIVVSHPDQLVVREAGKLANTRELPPGCDTLRFVYIRTTK